MAGTRMGVVGCGGRMGRMLLAEIAASEGCDARRRLREGRAAAMSTKTSASSPGSGALGISVGDNAEKLIRDSDVVIEFTTPAATAVHAAQAAGLGKAMVIGTTGLSAAGRRGGASRRRARFRSSGRPI